MKRFLSILLKSLLILGVLVIGLWCFVIWWMGRDYVSRQDSPVARAEAVSETGFFFPPEASDIYYVVYVAGLQIGDFYYRFKVPEDRVRAAVDHLVAEDNTFHGRSLKYPEVPIAKAPESGIPKNLVPIDWWKPSSITDGFYRTDDAYSVLEIWADKEGVIYVHVSP